MGHKLHKPNKLHELQKLLRGNELLRGRKWRLGNRNWGVTKGWWCLALEPRRALKCEDHLRMMGLELPSPADARQGVGQRQGPQGRRHSQAAFLVAVELASARLARPRRGDPKPKRAGTPASPDLLLVLAPLLASLLVLVLGLLLSPLLVPVPAHRSLWAILLDMVPLRLGL